MQLTSVKSRQLVGFVASLVFALGATAVPLGCSTPLSTPANHEEVHGIRVDAVRNPDASVRDVHVYRKGDHVVVVGRVFNDTMRVVNGGRVLVQLIDTDEAVVSEGTGPIESSQIPNGGAAPFRIEINSTKEFSQCRVVVQPEFEGR
ncbi:MAG: hypothetical protein HYR85_26450 [Planctomycetes bacterium]|nr:hypothetical protein [Planctomycetota bacterium]